MLVFSCVVLDQCNLVGLARMDDRDHESFQNCLQNSIMLFTDMQYNILIYMMAHPGLRLMILNYKGWTNSGKTSLSL